MAYQLSTHFLIAFHRAGEHATPRLQNRVILIPGVQIDRPVIGINGSLHRVTDIVHRIPPALRTRRILRITLRIGELVSGRITIHNPHHTIIHNCRVRLRINLQIRGSLTHTIHRITLIQDLRAITHRIRQQNIGRLEFNSVRETVQPRIHARPTATRKRVLRVCTVCLISRLRAVKLKLIPVAAHNRILR